MSSLVGTQVLKPHCVHSPPAESAHADNKPPTQSTQSSSSSGSGGLNPSSGPPGSSASTTVPVSPVLQSPTTPLLQDPSLLRQLLPALQTALQLNNASGDMAKINEGEPTSVRNLQFSKWLKDARDANSDFFH